MTFGRRERLLIGAAVIGLTALACDWLLFSAPKSAVAADALASEGTGAPTLIRPEDLDFPEPQVTGAELSHLIVDVFAPERVRSNESVAAPAAPPVAAPAAPPPPLEESFQLRATLVGPAPRALVGRRMLRLGDMLGDLELVEVGPDYADFRGPAGERQRLTVQGRSAKSADSGG